MKKTFVCMIMALAAVFIMLSAPAMAETTVAEGDIVILYTGDVHGNAEEGLTYAGVSAYRKEMQQKKAYVELIDAGDALNGGALATVSDGEYAIEAMNAAGYTMFVPGVYDFSYGVSQLAGNLRNNADFSFLSCNFAPATGGSIFAPYEMKTYGSVKVAYIGITDPETISKSQAFSKSTSGNYSYTFMEGSRGALLYSAVQNAVDDAKAKGANYIVAVGNLSEDKTNVYSVQKVISNTKGINAFINSGSHVENSFSEAVDKGGNLVLITNPGKKLGCVGVMVISPKKKISSQLVFAYSSRDILTKLELDKLNDKYSPLLKSEFAETPAKLTASDTSGNRVVESSETNFGDLAADAVRKVTGADVGLVQACDIKANLPEGGITYGGIFKALGNEELCICQVSGMEIMDALEMSVRKYPSRTADFLQVSGLTFDIQETVISRVKTNTYGKFTGVDGDYRVTNIKVNGKALDPLGTYTVAGTVSFMRGETGYSMFSQGTILQNNMITVANAMLKYLSGELAGKVGEAYSAPQLRMDIIKLARQSEIDAQAEARARELMANRDDQIAELLAQIADRDRIIQIKDCSLKLSSATGKTSTGKPYVKLTWTPSQKIDGIQYQLYKSDKKSSGFKRIATTGKTTITNTSGLTKGKTYYYKVRAYVVVDGVYYYTAWSNKAYRTIK